MNDYAELHCLTHFSFGRGASSARELFARARRNGYRALAITDECTFAGVVRALEAAREFEVSLIVGTEVTLQDGLKLVLLAENAAGYSNLCQLITHGRRRAAKGTYTLTRADLAASLLGVLVLWIPRYSLTDHSPSATALSDGQWIRKIFGLRAWLACRDGIGVCG